MSSRDIEGENPLYLPQAKVYDGELRARPVRAASRPSRCRPRPRSRFAIRRAGRGRVRGRDDAGVDEAARRAELVEYLFRDNSFPQRLHAADRHGHRAARRLHAAAGDEIAITIEPIGTLVNVVA